jgi:hypothetical protein
MIVRLALVSINVITISLMLISLSHAEINMDTCMGAWLFDEGNGDEAMDWTDHGNDGEIMDADWTDGKFGKALDFDGASSRVVIQDSDVFNDIDEITILAWVNLRRGVTSGTWNAIAGKNPYGNGYLMWIEVPNEPCGLVFSPGRADDRSAVQIDTDRWYHLAFTRAVDGGMKFYIDGEMVKEAPSTSGPIATKAGPLSIGGQSPQIVDGLIDEVIFFNTVLEEEDIDSIMTSGLEQALAVSAKGKLTTTWAQVKAE